jgi:hypothetical protein
MAHLLEVCCVFGPHRIIVGGVRDELHRLCLKFSERLEDIKIARVVSLYSMAACVLVLACNIPSDQAKRKRTQQVTAAGVFERFFFRLD